VPVTCLCSIRSIVAKLTDGFSFIILVAVRFRGFVGQVDMSLELGLGGAVFHGMIGHRGGCLLRTTEMNESP